ncbi:MAG: TIR domain-containing protein [Bacilli bacterium]|nr:TIR domain-containing protein [Bacilli bacterium]
MKEKEYKYDAFISYRHCDLDKYVAENLHKVLETYELPKNIKEKLGITGRTIKRVFRDQDELPLSSNLEDPIVEALKESKYLIVICSPRLKESMWCKKEIETFKKLRGRKNIFCVLIEGEPKDSFPEEICFDEIETIDKNGKKKIEKKPVEPLAADVRGETKKEVLKKIKEEKLRLIAPMYNLDYDDLKQRHKLRKMRRMFITSACVSAFCILFTIYSLLMFLKIYHQQKTLKTHQALSLSEDAMRYMKVDSKHSAVKSAYEALTKFNGVKMPYTPEAEYALSESLGVYNAGLSYKAMDEVKTKGVIDYIKSSYDDNYALSFDESEELVLWDINKLKKIKTYSDLNAFAMTKDQFTFIGNDKLAYINKIGNVIIASTKNGKVLKEIKKDNYGYMSVKSNEEGKYLIINDSPKLYLYDAETYKNIATYSSKEKIAKEIFTTFDGSKIFIGTSKNSADPFKEDNVTVHVLNSKDLNEMDSFELEARYLNALVEKNNNVYILSNQSVGNDYHALVTSYNVKNNKVNWTKKFNKDWGEYIQTSLAEGTHNIAFASGNVVTVMDDSDGSVIKKYSLTSDVIDIYVSTTNDTYIVFTADGTVHFVSVKYEESIVYGNLFELNLDNYKAVILNKKGYLLIAENDNRIIYYEKDSNKNLKEEKVKLDYPKNQSIAGKDLEKIKKEYDLKKKNLIKYAIYDDKKTLLFISYTDSSLGIYSVKDKKLIKMIDDVTVIEYYFGKDKENRVYVGNITDSYIIDKDYNKVGHINSLNKVDKKNNKIYIKDGDNSYSLPIYYLDDLLKEAKAYLNK